MEEHEHKEEHHTHKKGLNIKKSDLWKSAAAVLAILLVISLYFNIKGDSGKENVISPQEAADKTIDYINNNLLESGSTATLTSVSEKDNMYNIKFGINGQSFDSYVTKDGNMLFPSSVDMSKKVETPAAEPPAELEKSDKPSVELFVMSYCPYGIKAQEILAPVMELLDKKADMRVRFVYYAMHGKKEIDENLFQYCIQEEENEKYADYLECFTKNQDTAQCMSIAKISKEKVDSCVEKTDAEFKVNEKYNDQTTWLNGRYPLFEVDKAIGDKYGIAGSESLVINGYKVSPAQYRWSPENLKGLICSAFNNPPAECSTTLEGGSDGNVGQCS